jgi:hypothetical protein
MDQDSFYKLTFASKPVLLHLPEIFNSNHKIKPFSNG